MNLSGNRGVVTSVAAVMLTACTVEPSSTTGNATGSGDEGLVCVKEKPTGSHIPRKVCRSVAQIEREQEAAREIASSPSTQNLPSGGN